MRKHLRALLDHIVPGPLLGLWSWRYLDRWRTVRLVTSPRVHGMYTRFYDRLPVGAQMPVIDLPRTDGSRVRTEEFRDRSHLVIWTGAIT